MNYYVAFILKKFYLIQLFLNLEKLNTFATYTYFTVLPDPEYQYFE